ncbi:MAG: type VII toxin-antitoxin system HepT family RNase toxin [Caldisericia bacterium]
MINKDLIYKKLNEINEILNLLEEYKKLSLEEFLNDREVVDAIKYRFIKIIEACMNICNHIVVKKYNIIPETYGDCFKILGEKNLINKNLANNLVKMVRFRNLLIHLYSKVDDSEVYKILKENLDDVKNFVKEVSEIL